MVKIRIGEFGCENSILEVIFIVDQGSDRKIWIFFCRYDENSIKRQIGKSSSPTFDRAANFQAVSFGPSESK